MSADSLHSTALDTAHAPAWQQGEPERTGGLSFFFLRHGLSSNKMALIASDFITRVESDPNT